MDCLSCGRSWKLPLTRAEVDQIIVRHKAVCEGAPKEKHPMGAHLVDGKFQSDKYPTTPRGKVPLSVEDPTAQDLLWEYAQRRRAVDAEFAADLEVALFEAGYTPPPPIPAPCAACDPSLGCLQRGRILCRKAWR